MYDFSTQQVRFWLAQIGTVGEYFASIAANYLGLGSASECTECEKSRIDMPFKGTMLVLMGAMGLGPLVDMNTRRGMHPQIK